MNKYDSDGILLRKMVEVYLNNKGTKNYAAKNKVVEDAVEDVPFPVDLAGVDFIEKLHQYKGVEDNGVVFRGRGVERRIPPIVNIKQLLSCTTRKKQQQP